MNKIIPLYLDSLRFKQSRKTQITYQQGIRTYIKAVGPNAPISLETYIKFLKHLNPYSPSTQSVYRSAVVDMYKFFCFEHDGNVNLLAMESADKRYLRGSEKRQLHFNREAIEKLIQYAESLHGDLAAYRDRAFIIMCADSGLRISEACALTRGQIPWKDGELYIIGKGDKEEKIYFSRRALAAIELYLKKRAKLDGGSGQPLESLPVFARHDRGAGKKIKPVHAGGMWYTFVRRMNECGIEKGAITPHVLRHFAVTRYYEATRDIKKTKAYSRHSRIETVDRYTHIIDQDVKDSYDEIFNKE